MTLPPPKFHFIAVNSVKSFLNLNQESLFHLNAPAVSGGRGKHFAL